MNSDQVGDSIRGDFPLTMALFYDILSMTVVIEEV